MKYRSRNRARELREDEIKCPFCGCQWDDDTEEDRYKVGSSTYVHYCRECGLEFINGVTRDIEYKYS